MYRKRETLLVALRYSRLPYLFGRIVRGGIIHVITRLANEFYRWPNPKPHPALNAMEDSRRKHKSSSGISKMYSEASCHYHTQ